MVFGLFDDQTVTGDIVNQTADTITAGEAGIDIEIQTFPGNIINQGLAVNAGVTASTCRPRLFDSTAAGNITNSGTINADFNGIFIADSTIYGSIVDTEQFLPAIPERN